MMRKCRGALPNSRLWRAEHRLEWTRDSTRVGRTAGNAANALANHMALDRRMTLGLRRRCHRAVASRRRHRRVIDAAGGLVGRPAGSEHAGRGRRRVRRCGLRCRSRWTWLVVRGDHARLGMPGRRLTPYASGFEADVAFRGVRSRHHGRRTRGGGEAVGAAARLPLPGARGERDRGGSPLEGATVTVSDPQRGKQSERSKDEPQCDCGSRDQDHNGRNPVRQFRRGRPEANVNGWRAAEQSDIDHPSASPGDGRRARSAPIRSQARVPARITK
jgi:hypothetical protein